MSIWNDFLSLFYPRYCLACEGGMVKGEDVFCTECLSQLPKTNYHLEHQNPVKTRLAGRIPLDYAFAFLRYKKGGIVQNILHQLKYKNQPEIGLQLGKMYGRDLKNAAMDSCFDIIVPVPLHASRQRRRGYNQSALFAQGLSESLGVNWAEGISQRVTTTSTQTKKNRADRWKNVEDAFAISRTELIQGKRILLVDDVITTGATIEACGHHLLRQGAASLSVGCIAEA